MRNAGPSRELRDLATHLLVPHSASDSHLISCPNPRLPLLHPAFGSIGSKSPHSYLNSAADFETTCATPHPAGISTTIHARKTLTFSAEAVGSVMCPLPMM